MCTTELCLICPTLISLRSCLHERHICWVERRKHPKAELSLNTTKVFKKTKGKSNEQNVPKKLPIFFFLEFLRQNKSFYPPHTHTQPTTTGEEEQHTKKNPPQKKNAVLHTITPQIFVFSHFPFFFLIFQKIDTIFFFFFFTLIETCPAHPLLPIQH